MPRFSEKVVIVTGSSSGIGAATAVLFASEGAKVTITGQKAERLEETRRKMLNAGVKDLHINIVLANVMVEEEREKLVNSTVVKWGRIDILVNCAGGSLVGENGTMGFNPKCDPLERLMQLNVYSVAHIVELARPHLVAAKGEVINISSIAGCPMGFPNFPYYATTKAALDQLTRALALDMIKHGVRVNSVSPGPVHTRFFQSSGFSDETVKKAYELYEVNRNALPVGKLAEPEDIANIIAFLADRRLSSYIVGQTIVADGGTTLLLASTASEVDVWK